MLMIFSATDRSLAPIALLETNSLCVAMRMRLQGKNSCLKRPTRYLQEVYSPKPSRMAVLKSLRLGMQKQMVDTTRHWLYTTRLKTMVALLPTLPQGNRLLLLITVDCARGIRVSSDNCPARTISKSFSSHSSTPTTLNTTL